MITANPNNTKAGRMPAKSFQGAGAAVFIALTVAAASFFSLRSHSRKIGRSAEGGNGSRSELQAERDRFFENVFFSSIPFRCQAGAGFFLTTTTRDMTVIEKLEKISALKQETAELAKEVKNDLKALRKKLPKGWSEELKSQFPELNTFDAGARVNDVLNGRSMDESLIKALETLCR